MSAEAWNRIAFAVVVVAITVLVALGKMHPEAFMYVVGAVQPSVLPPKAPPGAGATGAALCLAVALLVGACGGPPPISEKGQQEIASHAVVLEACKAEWRASGSYSVYEACLVRAGVNPRPDGGR
jgi:hypothetical protein